MKCTLANGPIRWIAMTAPVLAARGDVRGGDNTQRRRGLRAHRYRNHRGRCKDLVGTRMKRAGSRFSQHGGQTVMTFRAAVRV